MQCMRGNLGFRFLLKDTLIHRLEEQGIKPLNFWCTYYPPKDTKATWKRWIYTQRNKKVVPVTGWLCNQHQLRAQNKIILALWHKEILARKPPPSKFITITKVTLTHRSLNCCSESRGLTKVLMVEWEAEPSAIRTLLWNQLLVIKLQIVSKFY